MPNLTEILDRLKSHKGFTLQKEVAQALGMASGNALSNHHKRGTIPWQALVEYCVKENISINWLVTGQGNPVAQIPEPNPDPPELTRLKDQLGRVYHKTDDRAKGRVEGMLAGLDPGE